MVCTLLYNLEILNFAATWVCIHRSRLECLSVTLVYMGAHIYSSVAISIAFSFSLLKKFEFWRSSMSRNCGNWNYDWYLAIKRQCDSYCYLCFHFSFGEWNFSYMIYNIWRQKRRIQISWHFNAKKYDKEWRIQMNNGKSFLRPLHVSE